MKSFCFASKRHLPHWRTLRVYLEAPLLYLHAALLVLWSVIDGKVAIRSRLQVLSLMDTDQLCRTHELWIILSVVSSLVSMGFWNSKHACQNTKCICDYSLCSRHSVVKYFLFCWKICATCIVLINMFLVETHHFQPKILILVTNYSQNHYVICRF